MKEFHYIIRDETGVHIRPAGELVKLAQGFGSEVAISCGARSANLQKLFALMGMAIKQGEQVMVTASSEDEQAAIEAIGSFLENNL